MAAAPKWKVFDANGDYQAACKEIEAAAAVVSLYGNDSTIRFSHAKRTTVWTEGTDGHAADSYDAVARAAYTAERNIQIAAVRKTYGADADEMLKSFGLSA